VPSAQHNVAMPDRLASPADRHDRRQIPDAVGFLTGYVIVLVAVPSRLVFAPLGSAGTPAQLIGIGFAVWWACMWLATRGSWHRLRSPVVIAMATFVGTILISYLAAASRPIESDELSSADVGVLSVVAWLGVLLVASDHVRSRERLNTLLRRVSVAGGALATLGVLQFVTGQPFTNYIVIPGLTENNALTSVLGRDGLTRPAGTALHPIEFGAVLTMVLPLALHFALTDTHRAEWRRWYPVAAICLAVPISLSRSALVSSLVVLCVLLPTWPKTMRRRAYLVLVGLLGFLYVFVPGLLGTLTGLFTGIVNDTSAESRTDSYGLAGQFISHSPLVGRGFFTFLPSYRILDNQYLLLLIETGVLGATALLVLFITGIASAIRARQRLNDPVDRQLAQVLMASVASVSVSFALFDAFSFPMVPSLVFLLLGCTAALVRMAPPAPKPRAHLLTRALRLVPYFGRRVPASPSTGGRALG
jgi:polysaccharide biosynthesis protein PslJ